MSYPELRSTITVTIALGASLSPAADLSEQALLGIVMPAAWTAGDLTFQGSIDGVTYGNMYFAHTDSECVVQAAAARFIQLDPADFSALRYIKVRSGTSGTPVNQAAARTITLIVRPI
jgi:hypothetical protein